MITEKEKTKIVYGEEMEPCPKCGSYDITGQTPVKLDDKVDTSDAKSLLSSWAKMKRTGTDELEGPCFIMCRNCLHKGPSVNCSGRTATDVGSDPDVWRKMKDLWNNQLTGKPPSDE